MNQTNDVGAEELILSATDSVVKELSSGKVVWLLIPDY